MQRSKQILETSECRGTSLFLFITGNFTYIPMCKTLLKIILKNSIFYFYSKDIEKE